VAIVKVNIAPLTTSLVGVLPSKKDLDRILRALGDAARDKWIELASQNLNSTATTYIDGISQPQINGTRLKLTLAPGFPEMIENGFSGGDMRDALLGPNSNRKESKDGFFYNSIPMRKGTPGTHRFGKPMPRAIHNVAKALAATASRPYGIEHGREGKPSKVHGQALHPGLAMSEKTRKVLMKKEKPWHEGPLYVGMRRMEGPSESNPSRMNRHYMTFRTISSRPTMKVKGGHKVLRGWIHPGIRARRFAPRECGR
jgi:hypothetical protein